MSRFVIIGSDGFYTGEHYTNQGERFAIFDKKIHRAKIYKSLKRAINACKKLSINYTNCSEYFGGVKVVEVKDDD